jgi:type IV fimbrial biogenesis protein FimT
MKSRHTGFTLIEVAITLAIIGILLAFAIPGITTFIKNARISSVTSEISADISLARQEAQRRGRPVTICASSDGTTCLTGTPDWLNGWVIRAPILDGTVQVVKSTKDLDGPVSTRKLTGLGTASMTFSSSGTAVSGAGGAILISIRDDRAGSGDLTQRDVSVNLVGRPLTTKVTG